MDTSEINCLVSQCRGTSPTNSQEFDSNGYIIIPSIWDPNDLISEQPSPSGEYTFYGSTDKYSYKPDECQVPGSTSRYYYPAYKYAHSQIRLKLEKAIGKRLYNTYYYDRFYKPGQELSIHVDRPACEISVTVHVGSNCSKPWPIWIRTPQDQDTSVLLKPGDGMVYKGCECPHWRNPLEREFSKTWYGRSQEVPDRYYHQIFFHYVLADGIRADHAFDR